MLFLPARHWPHALDGRGMLRCEASRPHRPGWLKTVPPHGEVAAVARHSGGLGRCQRKMAAAIVSGMYSQACLALWHAHQWRAARQEALGGASTYAGRMGTAPGPAIQPCVGVTRWFLQACSPLPGSKFEVVRCACERAFGSQAVRDRRAKQVSRYAFPYAWGASGRPCSVGRPADRGRAEVRNGGRSKPRLKMGARWSDVGETSRFLPDLSAGVGFIAYRPSSIRSAHSVPEISSSATTGEGTMMSSQKPSLVSPASAWGRTRPASCASAWHTP